MTYNAVCARYDGGDDVGLARVQISLQRVLQYTLLLCGRARAMRRTYNSIMYTRHPPAVRTAVPFIVIPSRRVSHTTRPAIIGLGLSAILLFRMHTFCSRTTDDDDATVR